MRAFALIDTHAHTHTHTNEKSEWFVKLQLIIKFIDWCQRQQHLAWHSGSTRSAALLLSSTYLALHAFPALLAFQANALTSTFYQRSTQLPTPTSTSTSLLLLLLWFMIYALENEANFSFCNCFAWQALIATSPVPSAPLNLSLNCFVLIKGDWGCASA